MWLFLKSLLKSCSLSFIMPYTMHAIASLTWGEALSLRWYMVYWNVILVMCVCVCMYTRDFSRSCLDHFLLVERILASHLFVCRLMFGCLMY